MNKILIVDDNQENIDDIKNIIDVYFKEKDFNYHIDYLENSTNFDYSHQYNIIFLDIDMPQQSGFDLAKSIPLNTFIVFVSHREDLAYLACEHHPFSFVRKHHLKDDMIKTLDRLYSKLNQTLSITYQNENICIPYHDILYIESIGHYIYIHTQTNIYKIRVRLSDLLTQLNNNFCLVHQSYIINFSYIISVQDLNILLTNNEIIPISQRRYKDFQSSYQQYKLRSI